MNKGEKVVSIIAAPEGIYANYREDDGRVVRTQDDRVIALVIIEGNYKGEPYIYQDGLMGDGSLARSANNFIGFEFQPNSVTISQSTARKLSNCVKLLGRFGGYKCVSPETEDELLATLGQPDSDADNESSAIEKLKADSGRAA